jgi:2-methylisocitrate lyase-like PEP mutase family enzyme
MIPPRARLRELLSRPAPVIAPGAYDAISVRAVEHAGFEAAYMTGSGVSAANGFPDFGLLTLTEMAATAKTLARSVRIPVIADADTGYGNELNVTRTVREYESAGVSGLHIEDQVSPKRCGHLDGKELISRDEFVAKIRAAVAARQDPDLVLIARTDARSVAGLDEAIVRANAAIEAGADMAFVEAAQSMEELALIPQRVKGPCLLNVVQGGKTPNLGPDDVARMGYRIAILPSLLTAAALSAFDAALANVRAGHQLLPAGATLSLKERFRRFGADEWNDIRTRFGSPQAETAAGGGR